MAYAVARPPSAGGRASISLENFNEHAHECLVNSPRSLAAMKRLGISGAELQFKPPSHRSFAEGVDQQTAESVPDYISKRFNHAEHKRQAKVRALREERAAMIEHGQGGQQMVAYSGVGGAHHGADSQLVARAIERNSTAIEMEREQMARMQQRLLTKLNNTLAFEIRRAQTLDRAQSKVEYAHARAEAEKQYRAQVQAEREEMQKNHVAETQRRLAHEAEERRRLADQAWRDQQAEKEQKMEADRQRRRAEREAQVDHRNRNEEKRLQLEAIQDQQRQAIAEKEWRLQQKEEERLRNQEDARRQLHEYNEQASRAAREKLEQAAARSQQVLDEKRNRWLDKEAAAEQKRREFEDAREWERLQAKRRAHEKEQQLKHAQAQAEALLHAKAHHTLAKEQSVAERLAERDRMRAAEEHERKMWLQDRERHRRAILEQSYHMREARGNQILAKRAELNARSDETLRQRHAEIRERKLAESMLAADRKEQVQRMARIQANQREELLARIQSDADRIQSLQHQSQQLAHQRMRLRAEAEKQQAILLDRFEQLKAHPERLRNIDPNGVDVIKMGLLTQEDLAQMMNFSDSYDSAGYGTSHGRSRSQGGTPTHAKKRSVSSAGAGRETNDGNIMERPLPRPQTTQNGRQAYHHQQQQQAEYPSDYGQPSQQYQEYTQQLATH